MTIMAPPKPEKNANNHMHERMQVALDYADTTLRNKAENYYHSAYGEWCFTRKPVVNTSSSTLRRLSHLRRTRLRRYDSTLYHIADVRRVSRILWLLKSLNSSSAQKLQDKILELKRTEFSGRYGEILARICNKPRANSGAEKTTGWFYLSRTHWTNIINTIEEGNEAYQAVLNGKNEHSDCPTTLAVLAACRQVV